MKLPENIEILINGVAYVSLGQYMDNRDGISSYYPNGVDGYSWLKKLESEEPVISLFLIGNLYHYFDDDGNAFEEIFESDLFNLFSQKKSEFMTFVSKYFEDASILMVNSMIFEDIVYGAYSENNDNNVPLNWNPDPDSDIKGADIGDDLFFEDGTVITFINKEQCWDDLNDQIMIKRECHQVFLEDLNKIVSVFQSFFDNDCTLP